MLSATEYEITKQMLRSRFDAYMLKEQQQEASAVIDLAWRMGLRLLAAQMVIAMAEHNQRE